MKHDFNFGAARRRPASRRRAKVLTFWPRKSRRGFGSRSLSGMVAGGIAAGLAWAMLPPLGELDPRPAVEALLERSQPAPAQAGMRINFGFCHSGGGSHCVVDGDTFWMAGEKIRIADIDTPETHPARCAREAELGAAATRRLHELLNGGAVMLTSAGRDVDRYGRKLRIVSVDGVGVGETLVQEGLARRYAGGRRAGWCD